MSRAPFPLAELLSLLGRVERRMVPGRRRPYLLMAVGHRSGLATVVEGLKLEGLQKGVYAQVRGGKSEVLPTEGRRQHSQVPSPECPEVSGREPGVSMKPQEEPDTFLES